MNKLKEIVLSYATKLNPTEEQKEIAEQRLEMLVRKKSGQYSSYII